MFAGNRNVFHPCVFGHLNPIVWIEFRWIKKGGNLLIRFDGNLLVVHDPLPIAEHTVYTPVYEQSEFGVLEPFAVLQVFRSGYVFPLPQGWNDTKAPERQGKDNDSSSHCLQNSSRLNYDCFADFAPSSLVINIALHLHRPSMRYKKIDQQLFIRNRQNLLKELKKNSVVVVNANDIMPTNADGTMRFRQNSDLFYLAGVDQEETILVLCPDFPDEKYREVLFLRETNEQIALWEGNKLTKEEARENTGVKTVLWTTDFPRIFNIMMVMGNVEHVYLNTNDHYRADVTVDSRDQRFIQWCQKKYPLHRYERLAPIMHRLRSIKSPAEIALMQQACDITEKAFRRVLKFVKPGVTEYEIEAEYAHEFLRNGSRGFAYEPIIASGPNSCVLHYILNDQVCKDGDILLLDVGAEYANYNADLTRAIPVNGRFTPRQRQVYNAVLRIQRAAMKLLKPGVLYYEYHREVQKITEEELIGLRLLDKKEVEN